MMPYCIQKPACGRMRKEIFYIEGTGLESGSDGQSMKHHVIWYMPRLVRLPFTLCGPVSRIVTGHLMPTKTSTISNFMREL